MSLTILVFLLAALLVLRMPVAFAMGVTGSVGLAVQLGPQAAFAVLERVFIDKTSSFILIAIPLFILMAEFLTAGQVTKRAINACQAWIGHVRGGLAVAAVGSAVLMAALIGSSTASTAAMTASAYPEMRRHKYNDRLATAVCSVGGTLAVVVPPSIILVVYGVLTETSIGQLFIAGIIPGLLTALGIVIVIKVIAHTTDYAPAGDQFRLGHAVRTSRHILPMVVLIVIVIGVIYGGIASPSEAAAFGVMGALLIGLSQRTLAFRSLGPSLSMAVRSTVMILTIIVCAHIFANYLSFTRVTQNMLVAIEASGLPHYVIMGMIVLTLLVMGMFMDQLAILALAMPIAFPAAMAMGYDPVWFGIIVTKTVEIGLLTPPLGLNAYIAAGHSGVPLGVVFRGLIPFVALELVVLTILLLFPSITLWLPSLMMGT